MLFSDFFPRLRDHAWQRYGQTVTERQFKDWREDGLLPGPALPKGRGRGRSPERHWPIASYRRALRICRYKSWGANRQSQWWLGLWVSGELVDSEKFRNALKREFSVERRAKLSFIESNRWRNGPFGTLNEARRGGLPGKTDLASLMNSIDVTPDQVRRVSILEIEDFSDSDIMILVKELVPNMFGISDSEETAAIVADIAPDEIRRIWRPGHMAEGTEKPGKYLNRLTDSDFAICLDIMKIRENILKLNFAFFRIMGHKDSKQILISLLFILATRAEALQSRISQLLRIAYEIDVDAKQGVDAKFRLKDTIDGHDKLISSLQSFALEMRKI